MNKKTLNQHNLGEKTNPHNFRQNVLNPHFCSFATFYFTSLRKLLLLHNLSRINTHDKFTREDAVITEMIGSKPRFFQK